MKYFLLLLSLALLSGCETDSNGFDTDGSGTLKVPFKIENTSGQKVITIPYDSLKTWLESNKNIHIVSICGIDKASHGSTTSFLIVYEEGHDKKCKECGQQLPAEKAN